MKKPLNYYLIRLDRLAAWILLFSMVVYFITGYGLTKGLIDPALAASLHLDFLPLVVLVAFIAHSSFAVHLALKRHDAWKPITKTLLFAFYFFFLGFIVYVDRFYKPTPLVASGPSALPTNEISSSTTSATPSVPSASPTPTPLPTQSPAKTPSPAPIQPTPIFSPKPLPTQTPSPTPSPTQMPPPPTSTPTTAPSPSLPTFSAAQLARYNGQNGRPAYVAVNGKVYDVSRAFRRGTHYSHLAGRDLTAEFNSVHSASFLTNMPIVGIYNKTPSRKNGWGF